ncbi:MAG TPA: hypothetical protein DCE71_04235 [Parachlamydiales bacterium]|nr:hypothetical protein [Parachlamydiales bacterium]
MFSFFLQQGLDFFSEKIFLYREEIFYAGIGFSALAILAALSTKIACMILFTVGAALCFALASWAFRTREYKLSQEAGSFDARLQRVAKIGEDQTVQERNLRLALQKGFDQQEDLLRQKNGEIMTLRVEVENISQTLSDRNAELEKLKDQNRRLLIIEQRVQRLL